MEGLCATIVILRQIHSVKILNTINVMSFQILNQSIFDTPADAFVNTINCTGAMGVGIALEFKKRYPKMYDDYRLQCQRRLIKPGDCYTYWDDENHVWLLGLAVKNDWRYWSTMEWLEGSLKSMKLVILENDIKSVNMPLACGMNARRGPYGKVSGMMPLPSNKNEIQEILKNGLETFSDKFGVIINLCIPNSGPKKPDPDLTQFLEK